MLKSKIRIKKDIFCQICFQQSILIFLKNVEHFGCDLQAPLSVHLVCSGVLSEILGFSNVIGIFFFAPVINGQLPSACEQDITTANSEEGLTRLSYFFDL